MCQGGAERPQRRHRAMYLAPSAQHNQQTHGDGGDDDHNNNNTDHVIPMLVEVPTQQQPVSPPSSGELSPWPSELEYRATRPPRHRSYRRKAWHAIRSLYHSFIDLCLLVVVCFMGCFFYDVEVKVVKGDRRRPRGARGSSGRNGRVVIRTNNEYFGANNNHHLEEEEPGLTTSLLRTPPRSQSGETRSRGWSRSSLSPTSRDYLWTQERWDIV